MQFVQRFRFAVQADHLLPAGVRHAGKDAALGGGYMVLHPLDAAGGNLLLVQSFQQQAASLVVPHHSDGKNIHAQGSQVHDCVAAAAGNHGALAVLQDQHWGFT